MITVVEDWENKKQGLIAWLQYVTGLTNVYGGKQEFKRILPCAVVTPISFNGYGLPSVTHKEVVVAGVIMIETDSRRQMKARLQVTFFTEDVSPDHAEAYANKFKGVSYLESAIEKLSSYGLSIIDFGNPITNDQVEKEGRWKRITSVDITLGYMQSITETIDIITDVTIESGTIFADGQELKVI